MEQFFLSKIEWLTEWFMQLFFDPMYFSHNEKSQKGSTKSEETKVHVISESITEYATQVIKKPLSVIRRKKMNIPSRISDLKPIISPYMSWIDTMHKEVCIKAKNTLNKIQSAFTILWYQLSFQ
nr:hypothetical protein [uncultured Carboxylicivirga sp.]